MIASRAAARFRRLAAILIMAVAPLVQAETAAKADAAAAVDAPDAVPVAVSPPADSRARLAIREVLSSADFTPTEKMKVPVRKKRAEAETPSDWMKDLEAFFRGVAKVLRAGVWVLAGIGILLLVFTLHYWWRVAAPRTRAAGVNVPTHVGGLDIRRESLPANISEAARLRCQAGDATGGLSLLYRGALSALVTRFACRILSSSTEDECVRLARPRLASAAQDYFARLTRSWQWTVYAGRRVDLSGLLALCDEYDAHFHAADPATEAASATSATAKAGAR